MSLTLFCGILWAKFLHSQECNRVTHWDLCFFPLSSTASAVNSDEQCLNLLFQAWFLDDGFIAGRRSDVQCTLSLIEVLGSTLGIYINLPQCELFSWNDTPIFPASMKSCHLPNMDILGAPIGDYLHCANFIAGKRDEARKLLSKLEEVAVLDPQVAITLLHICGSYCRLIHLTWTTPPSLASEAMSHFDNHVRQCFTQCLAVETQDVKPVKPAKAVKPAKPGITTFSIWNQHQEMVDCHCCHGCCGLL